MSAPHVVADLRLEVDGAAARLTGSGDRLRLDVERPVAFVRGVRRSTRATGRPAPLGAALDLLADSGVTVDVRTRGVRLAALGPGTRRITRRTVGGLIVAAATAAITAAVLAARSRRH